MTEKLQKNKYTKNSKNDNEKCEWRIKTSKKKPPATHAVCPSGHF
jgi:hypothetical protein